MSENLKRLNKFLSEAGYCSRRAADRLIDAGRVTILRPLQEILPQVPGARRGVRG